MRHPFSNVGHRAVHAAIAIALTLAAASCGARTARETVDSGSSSRETVDSGSSGGSEEAGSASANADSAAASSPIVLAAAEGNPVALLVDSANVYWLNLGPFVGPGGKVGGTYPNGEVRRCAIAGCNGQPTTLASGFGEPSGLPNVPGALALGNPTLYWAGNGSLLSCPVTGCSGGFATLASGGMTGVAVDTQRAYWTTYDTGNVASALIDGSSPPVALASGQVGPSSIVVDTTEVYWATYSGTVVACPPAGCPSGPTVLWSGKRATDAATVGLAQDASRLYWTNGNPLGGGSVFACDKADCPGTAVIIEDSASSPLGIAVDDQSVYWTELGDTEVDGQVVTDAGSVRKAPKLGGTVTTIADHQSLPSAVAVDSHAIYWATQGAAGSGQIFELTK